MFINFKKYKIYNCISQVKHLHTYTNLLESFLKGFHKQKKLPKPIIYRFQKEYHQNLVYYSSHITVSEMIVYTMKLVKMLAHYQKAEELQVLAKLLNIKIIT